MNWRRRSQTEFDLVGRLGSGGMGEVWLARLKRDMGAPVQVAVKRIRADLRENPGLLAQFQREARVCATLDHPNIVALRHFGVDEDGPYLALEYIPGPTASKLLKAYADEVGNLPVGVAVSIALDAARALSYAHELPVESGERRGVVHRDVSVDNILVGPDGVAKLTDFGLAKLADMSVHTQAGTLKGKLGYLAPELLDGAESDALTDVFAFGVTLYRLLCGVAPFVGKTDGELLRAIMSAKPPAPSAVRSGLSASLDSLVCRCLERERSRRPQSMRDVVRALEMELGADVASARAEAARVVSLAFPSGVAFAVRREDVSTQLQRPVRRGGRRSAWAKSLFTLVGVVAVALTWAGLRPRENSPVAPERMAAAPVAVPVAAPVPVADPGPAAPRAEATNVPARHKPTSRTPMGSLTIKVIPWGHVFVDGRLAGTSPLAPMAIEAGPHRILVANPELKAEQSVSVVVVAGKERAVKIVLQPGGGASAVTK